MKAELERIWNDEPLAWPMHVAGWSLTKVSRKYNKLVGIKFYAVKCKILNFKRKR